MTNKEKLLEKLKDSKEETILNYFRSLAEMKMKMTIEECKKRKREYKRMLENIELLKLSLLRSIAVEDLNIVKLKEKRKVKTND